MMFNLTPYRKHNGVSCYDPFQMMHDMERQFFGGETFSSFRTDIRDNGNAYVLEAELPGFDKDDISIQLSDNYLTISAVHNTESSEEDSDKRYIRRERSYGSYSRSFDVSDIDTAGIHAAYKNGILSLDLPKKTENTGGTRTVAIE